MVDHDALEGVADMTESQIFKAMSDPDYVKTRTMFGVNLYDILVCMDVLHRAEDDNEDSKAAEMIASGGAHGEYLKRVNDS